ncbi:MAG: HDOD domain-containing protein [Oscillospiraceae bacterium]|nr:HDOD domain-containing protein [Oscillospiraceae bacterium]
MQIVAVPLYDREMKEQAYIFRDLKENILFSTSQALNLFDGASTSEALRMLDEAGLDAFTLGKPVFVPISEIALMGGLHAQCKEPPGKIIFVLEKPLSSHSHYFPLVLALKARGYRFAINYPIKLAPGDAMLESASYIFLSQREERLDATARTLEFVKRHYRNLTPIAVHIYTRESHRQVVDQGYGLFETRLYEPARPGKEIGPFKVNAIRLINAVQDENFDFEAVADIVRGDPVLTISLLKLVNSAANARNQITSIQHAVAFIGQREVRKWVTTAVSRSLGDDRPSEITRISLIRARFIENLAPLFGMGNLVGELFILGLFSVIDSILDIPMDRALEQVVVPDSVRLALTENTGALAPVLSFVKDYENAAWGRVSRQMILSDMPDGELAQAYLSALTWYRDLIAMDSQTFEGEQNTRETGAPV